MSNLGFRGFENVSKKKRFIEKKYSFRKFFEEKIQLWNSIFLLRSKKVHFEVEVIHFEVKKSTSK
jgi:hypothetical protein